MSVLGILLAGGQSRRMGQDKSELVLDDKTLLERQSELLDEVCDHTLIARNQPGYVSDHYEAMGPLAGIHSCLRQALGQAKDEITYHQVVVVAVDMPLLSAKLVSDLIDLNTQRAKPVHYADQPFPMVIQQPMKALELLEQMLEDDQRMVTTFLEKLGAVAEPTCHDRMLVNTNTPLQWKLAQKYWEAQKQSAV